MPQSNQILSSEDLLSNTALRISIWILSIIALTGNIFVMKFRSFWRTTNKVNSFLINNLAGAVLLMGIYLLFIAIVDICYRGTYFIYDSQWRKSGWCQLLGFLATLSAAIKRWTLRQARLIMLFGWLFCTTLAAIPLSGIDYFENFYGRSAKMMMNIITDFVCWMPIIALGILSLNSVYIPSE
ncbi:G-protein coupled receptor GRL101-like protein, partial [Dinothrombium tinctorium]